MNTKLENIIETIIGICIMGVCLACAALAVGTVVWAYAVAY